MGPNQTQKFFCTVKETTKKREREKATHRMGENIYFQLHNQQRVSKIYEQLMHLNMPRST